MAYVSGKVLVSLFAVDLNEASIEYIIIFRQQKMDSSEEESIESLKVD